MSGTRGITLGRLAILVVLVLAVAVAGTLLATRDGGDGARGDGKKGAGDRPTSLPSADVTPYAYTTEDELVLIRDGRPPVRVPRVFDVGDAQQNTVVWSHDGRQLAFFSDDALLAQPENSRLITVDAATGEVRRLRCPNCYDLAPVGDHDVAVLRSDPAATRVLRFDLTDPKAAATAVTALPGNGSDWQIRFLGGTRNHLLTAQYTTVAGGDTAMDLRLLDAEGRQIASYLPFDSNAYMPAALATVGGKDRIAVAVRNNPGGCVAPFPIHLLDLNATAPYTDQSAALPPGYIPRVTGGIEVRDLWWAPDRHLYATISAWTCDNSKRIENDKQRLHRPATLFRLDGKKWVSAGDQPATVVRPLDHDTRMVLTIPDCVGSQSKDTTATYCNTGPLYRERDGRRTKVADAVLSLSAPPTAS